MTAALVRLEIAPAEWQALIDSFLALQRVVAVMLGAIFLAVTAGALALWFRSRAA